MHTLASLLSFTFQRMESAGSLHHCTRDDSILFTRSCICLMEHKHIGSYCIHTCMPVPICAQTYQLFMSCKDAIERTALRTLLPSLGRTPLGSMVFRRLCSVYARFEARFKRRPTQPTVKPEQLHGESILHCRRHPKTLIEYALSSRIQHIVTSWQSLRLPRRSGCKAHMIRIPSA